MTKYYKNVIQRADVNTEVKQTSNLRFPCVPCLWRQKNGNSRIDRRWEMRRSQSNVSTVFHFSFRLLTLLIFVQNISCQTTLVPNITPSSAYMEEQKQASLTCTLKTTAAPTSSDFPLSWYRDGGLPSTIPPTTSQQPGGQGETIYQSILYFTPTALDNEVIIVCNANIGSLSGSNSYSPQVILVPLEPIVSGPDSSEANENRTWTCKANGASQKAPNVYWRNGIGEALTNGVFKATSINYTPNKNTIFDITITITIALPAEANTYSLVCYVVHQIDQYSSMKQATKSVIVYFPPQITKNGGNTISINEGNQVSLSCIITISNPPATNVSWAKDGVSLNLTSGHYGPVSTNASSLTIFSALRSDHGDYVCTAANREGSTSFTTPTTLIVRYPPSVNNTGNETNIDGSAGGSLTISCPVDAVPPPTAIRWNKIVNGQTEVINVTGNPRYSGGTAVNQQFDLTINPLQADDAGTYFCEAINDLGTGTGSNTTVTVNFEPVVNVPDFVEAEEGDNFTISCRITMYPMVTSVVWFKGNIVLNITGSARKYSGGTVQNPSLTVQSAAKSDSGTYKCQGSNGTVTISGTIVVKITYAPKISVPTSDIIGRIGETATIHCTIDAEPPASSIIWQKSDFGSNDTADVVIGGKISSGSSLSIPSLTITNLMPRDMGIYYCMASNKYGNNTSDPVNLHVHYKPIVQVTSTPKNLTVGQRFQLNCIADAYPEVISYAWYRGSNKLSSTQEYLKPEAVLADYVDFRCDVTNVIGTSSATIRPNIEFSPQLDGTGKETITAKKFTIINLRCLVKANPEPTSYAWYMNGVLIPGVDQKNMSKLLSNDTDFGDYSCSAANTYNQLNPARQFTVIKDVGTSVASASLSTAMLVLIVLIVIIFLIIIFLLVICCCLHGVCADKRKKTKVNPTETADARNFNGQPALPPIGSKPSDNMNGNINNDDKYTGLPTARSNPDNVSRSSLQPADVNANGIINLNDDTDYPLVFPTARSNLSSSNNHGSIISVPEKTGARAYHLPPIDPEAGSAAHLKEDGKRRSRRKKHKNNKSEDKSFLTGSEERTDTNSPTT